MFSRITAASALAFVILVSGLFAAEPPAAAPDGSPRKVTIGFNLLSIPEIQEPAEAFTAICYLHLRWHDPALAGNETEQMLIEDAAIAKSTEIWRPDVHFVNEAATAEVKHAVLTIAPDGTVDFDREFEVVLKSDLDLRGFPFDRQVLTIEIESFAYSAERLVLEPNAGQMLVSPLKLAQWKPGALRWSTRLVHDPLERAAYHRLTLELEVARRPGFYVWQVFVPLFILIVIASTVFFLPAADLADRISVITTSLLTAVALSYAVHTDLPKISYLTAVDRLFVTTYVFLGAKILGMLAVKQLLEKNEVLAQNIDRRARWLFPIAYLGANAAIILLSLR